MHSECAGRFWCVSQRFILLTVKNALMPEEKRNTNVSVFLYRVYCMYDNAIISQVGVSKLNLY